MSASMEFSADQLDALREIVNIAMGRAGDRLARLLGCFIELPVPIVRFVDAPDVREAIRSMVRIDGDVTAVRQAFSSVAPGECIVIYGDASVHELGDLVASDATEAGAPRNEVLLEITNLLVGACAGGIGEQLGQELSYSAPSIIVANARIDEVLDPANVPWRTALLLEVNFRIEGRTFLAHILMFWPESAVSRVRESLDGFLADLG